MKHIAYFSIGLALLGAVASASGADIITINAHGSKLAGIGPTMQLWIDGNRVGTVNVDATVATDYTFSVTLPASGTVRLDVVFVNDAYRPPQDRNLFLNSVSVRGQTFLPTDAGVVLDRGSGSAAFDGRNAIPGQVGVYWNGATRFSVTLAADAGGNCIYPVYSGGTLRIGNESTINGHDISGRGNAIIPDTGSVTDATLDTRFFDSDSFPNFSGGGNYRGNGSGLIPGTRYDSVILTGGIVPNGDYQIGTLAIDGGVTFTGGAMYVKSMTISEEETVNFSAATLFHVGVGVSIEKEVRLRASGNPWAQFYLYGSADWRADKELRMDGLVLGAGEGANITAGKDSRITGVLITAGDITLDKEVELTYNATVQAALPNA
ncbi:MAG: hypothetical protein KGZ69_01475, partial [Methylomonas sp.]|nr:hypothetical protein [Methylomonas sp.]